MPGQSATVMQPTHWPAPLHIKLVPQLVPTGSSGFDGAPLVHTSFVQTLPSIGRSVLSLTVCGLPAPSHWFLRQSPVV